MATIAESVKRRAADRQADVTATHKSKRARLVEPDREENETQYLQHQCIHPNNANQASKHHDTELSTSIDCLPPERMAMIFSHLDCGDKVRAACMCSWWRDLIDIPSVWRDVWPIIDIDKVTDKHIKKMQTRMIKNVEIRKCDNMKKMTRFLLSLPQLKDLFINSPPSLTRLYPGKRTIPDIKQLTVNCSHLNTGVLRSFLQPMVNLQYLRLNCIPDGDILCALRHSKHLVFLHIRCCSDVVKIAAPSMGNLIPVSSLKQLTLEGVIVGDPDLDFISRAFPQLYLLGLMLSSDVTSEGLEKLAKLKQLKSLMIGSEHFEHDWFERLDTELPQLEFLTLYGYGSLSNGCLQSISKMPALCELCISIQDQEVEALHSLSQGWSRLHTLNLGFGNPAINHGLHVIQCMPNLQNLTLVACSVTDDFWRENSKSFSKLRTLSIMGCQLMSEQCLPHLSQMACLTRLVLFKCMNFEIDNTKHLGEWGIFKALTSLLLEDLGIKDDSLVELSKYTRFLEKLGILCCKNVTENGVAAAVTNLEHLKALVTDISAGIKCRLEKIRPHLQFYCV